MEDFKLTKEEKELLKKQDKYDKAVREKEIYQAKIDRKMKKLEKKIQKAQNYKLYKENTSFNTKQVSTGLYKYFDKKRKVLIILMVVAVIAAIFQTVTLWAFGYIYDKFFTPQTGTELVNNWKTALSAFIAVIVVLFVMYILNALFCMFNNIVMAKIGENTVCYNLRKDIFTKFQKLSNILILIH